MCLKENKTANNKFWVSRTPDKSAYLRTSFVIYHPDHMLWLLKESSQRNDSFDHPKYMFEQMEENESKFTHKCPLT